MKRSDISNQACSVARALDIVGEWWNLLILRDIFYGVRRFDALRRQLGISRKVLSERLDGMVAAGVLERRGYRSKPPRAEYRLTPMGVDLFPVLMALARWGDRWLAGPKGAPLKFVHSRCGQATQPEVRCAACGEDVGAHNLRPVLGPGADPDYVRGVHRAAGRGVFTDVQLP